VATPNGAGSSPASIKPKEEASVLSNKPKAKRRRPHPLDQLPWKLSNDELAQLQQDYPRLDVKALIRPAALKCREKYKNDDQMTAAFFRECLKICESDLDPPGLIEGRRLKEQLLAEPENADKTLSDFKGLIQDLLAKTRAT
jgi:hypothetical protein